MATGVTSMIVGVLISVEELSNIWNVCPRGVIHVGAHEAEEAQDYSEFNWGPTQWIEALPEKISLLKAKLADTSDLVFEATVWSEAGVRKELIVSNKSMSSSLLKFAKHGQLYPKVVEVSKIDVTTVTLDKLLLGKINADFLNLDIQGAELEALKGFSSGIKEMKWIYTEVNKKEIYENCAKVSEIDSFLSSYNFSRIATRWWRNDGWGDALYVRNDLITIDKPKDLIRKTSSNFKWQLRNTSRILVSIPTRFMRAALRANK